MPKPEQTSGDPYDSEIDKAQRLLEELRLKKEAQEKEEARLEQIEDRREEFILFQKEIVQKLRQTLPIIEEEITASKSEVTQYEQAKTHFQASLNRLQTIDAMKWDEAQVIAESERQQQQLVQAVEDYEEFAQYLSKRKKGTLETFTGVASAARSAVSFRREFLRGFAFNLPLILFGLILLVLLKF